jgi:glycosyltransferase involved in cell wall biosynthesis
MFLKRQFKELVRNRTAIDAIIANIYPQAVSPENTRIDNLSEKITETELKLRKLCDQYDTRSVQNELVIQQLRNKLIYRRIHKATSLGYFTQASAFARECTRLEHEIRADTYICRDVGALLAADCLREKVRLIVLDSISTLSCRERSTRFFRPLDPLVHALDRANIGLLSVADAAMGASSGVCTELARAGLRVIYIPDYPAPRPLRDIPDVREACALESVKKLVLMPGDIDLGLDIQTIIRALWHLPETYHLAIINNTEINKPRLVQVALENGLRERVHVLGTVEYEIWPAFVRGADVSVMVQDPKIPAHKLALPRVVFECICSGLPVIAGDIPDIQDILGTYGIGGRFERDSPASIAETIKDVAERKAEMMPALRRAAQDLVWQKNETKIIELFDKSEDVAILGIDGLVTDIRTRNIAATLIRHGIGVTVVTTERLDGDRPAGRLNHPVPGVKYVHVEI